MIEQETGRHLPNAASPARHEPRLEEAPLAVATREGEGPFEKGTGVGGAAAAELELGAGGRVEGVGREAVAALDGVEGFEAAVGAVALGEGDRAVEGDDGRRADPEQRVVERDDPRPVRLREG